MTGVPADCDTEEPGAAGRRLDILRKPDATHAGRGEEAGAT